MPSSDKEYFGVKHPFCENFGMLDKEIISEGSEKLINEKLGEMISRLKQDKIMENAKSFCTTYKHKGYNIRAIFHCLVRTYMKRTFDKGAWAYAKSVLNVENGNYNESDYGKEN